MLNIKNYFLPPPLVSLYIFGAICIFILLLFLVYDLTITGHPVRR